VRLRPGVGRRLGLSSAWRVLLKQGISAMAELEDF
jgi:hypothetical protein